MRVWHYQLLPYLPDLQFKGQLRELVSIMHDVSGSLDWDMGKTIWECSECRTPGTLRWKRCPVCEAKMKMDK